MATKKAKKKAAPKKAAPKKTAKKSAAKAEREVASTTKVKAKTGTLPAAKKPAKRASKPKGPVIVVRNHRFPPDTKVGFYPAHTVQIERGLGREPIPSPTASATVKARGLLEVRGLTSGQWAASGPVGDTYLYTQFSVS
jgi:hypothetical protein